MTRQDRAEVTRWQILSAAARVFTEVGYSGANVNEIVALAKVTKGALYFHFESKAFLARALIEERDRRLGLALSAIDDSKMPALEKLIHGSIATAALATSDVYFQAGDQLLLEVGDFHAAPERSIDWSMARMSALASSALEERDLVAVDPTLVAHLMMLQFVGARVVTRAVDEDFDLITYLEEIWKMLITSFVTDHVKPYFQQLVARMIAVQRDSEDMAVAQA